jgi:hypothetical protein
LRLVQHHLGGQDNITAYAVEDNRLWLRHLLQALGVQAATAAFVLYEFFNVGSDAMLRRAAVIIIVVGFLKYGERVWALKCASPRNLQNKKYSTGLQRVKPHLDVSWELQDTEELLWTAHFLLNIPKKYFGMSLSKTGQDRIRWHRPVAREKLFSLVEMQVSLMHYLLHTKAEVMHTWYGLCVRFICPASTSVAFVLFHWSGRQGYSRADVAITYVLLVGAIALEIISLLRAIFSPWIFAIRKFICIPNRRTVVNEKVWCSWWGDVVLLVRCLVLRNRWWADSMGQHNLFELYEGIKMSRSSRMARWIGWENWWNTRVYSRRIPVPEKMKGFLQEEFFKLCVGQTYPFFQIMKQFIYQQAMNISTEAEAMELDECILVWHIGTNVYLRWYKDQKLEQAKKEQAVDQEQPEDQEQAKREQAKEQQAMEHVETIEALSNYMLFIFVARSSMLPEITSRSHYVELCYDLSENKFDSVPDLRTARTKEDFVRKLQDYGRSSNPLTEIYTLWRGSRLGHMADRRRIDNN